MLLQNVCYVLIQNYFISKETFSNEEEGQRHVAELSSEENIHESMAMTMASCDVNTGMMLTDQSETSLFLNFELKSEEAILHILQSFQGNQLSESLKKVAGSLSRYYECEITLRASINVGAMLKSLEESGFEFYFPFNLEIKKTFALFDFYYSVKRCKGLRT
jgi:hypothetical protein